MALIIQSNKVGVYSKRNILSSLLEKFPDIGKTLHMDRIKRKNMVK